MDNDQLKQLDAKHLSGKEFDALDSILRGRGMPTDELIVQAAIDRELKAK